MDIKSIPPIGDDNGSNARAFQALGQTYAHSVQRALGPKELSGYGVEGRVLVAFSLGSDGNLTALRVARSSGHERLDRAALHIVGAAVFPAPPSGMSLTNKTYVSSFSFS